MARQARVISKTGYYHIIMRGNNKTLIFEHDSDKAYFMKCLNRVVQEESLHLLAWCLMDNHVHLLVKVEPEDLATVFKRINVKYAMWYHLQHSTVGHVFQDRFISEPIESDAYLLMVTRYVHNNPVKAKMVKKANRYSWSSYNNYMSGDLSESMVFVMGMFQKSKTVFEAFHLKEDQNEYLEIKEDQERYRMEKAQIIIDSFCIINSVIDIKDLRNNKEYLKRITKELLEYSGLSLRQVAKLIEIPYSTMQSRMSSVNNHRP